MKSHRFLNLISACLLIFAAVFVNSAAAEAALFEKAKQGPKIMLADVGCYGYNELQSGFLETFWEVMAEKFQSAKEINGDLITPGGEDAAAFRAVHIDAIIRGPLYERENACSEVVRYGDSIYGRDYFWDEKKLALRKERRGIPYFLGDDNIIAVQRLGEKYNVDYFLFCNLRNVETKLKNSIFNVDTNYEERAKEIKVEAEYYLVSVNSGKVYEGQNVTKKTSQILNIVFAEYGKGASVQQLMQVMFEEQAKRTVDDIKNKGLKALEGKGSKESDE